MAWSICPQTEPIAIARFLRETQHFCPIRSRGFLRQVWATGLKSSLAELPFIGADCRPRRLNGFKRAHAKA